MASNNLIQENLIILPTITVQDLVVGEADGTANFVLKLNRPSSDIISVKVDTFEFNADDYYDFKDISYSVSFAPGQTIQIVPVTLINDGDKETNEVLGLSLSSPTNAVIVDGVTTATIIDNDNIGSPNLAVKDLTIDETEEQALLTIVLDKASNQNVSVNYTTVEGTAATNADFQATSGTINFAPGETAKTIPVFVINDLQNETLESFTFKLSNPINAALDDPDALITINGNDSYSFAGQDFINNPSGYMKYIRDFDGNDLGKYENWKIIGAIDLQSDGDKEYVFVNPVIGRWASVGVDPLTGIVNFANHSWGGDTRVVGIYEDPLVKNGQVIKGSDFDSQKRFQNDLFIDNLTLIDNSGRDYDGNGLQEIYFKVNDGTAVLHALMHADGNIEYANYQSKSGLAEFMNAHGIDASLWNSWM
jgi:hypothetical protein